MAEITELVTKFSFKGNTEPLQKFTKRLGMSIKGLAGFATASLGAVAGLNLMAKSVLAGIDPIAQLNRQTGIAVESIQELGFAASVNGGSVEGMQSSLANLNQRIGEAIALGTGEGVAVFDKLGISLKDASGQAKTADIIFEELRASIERLNLDKTQAASIANKLGLDPATIQLLTKSNKEMDALRKKARELGIITKEQADAAADYNDSLTILNRAFLGIKRELVVGFAPSMKKSVESVVDFLKENKELIKTIATRVIKVVLSLAKAFTNVANKVFEVIKSFTKIKGAIFILTPIVIGLMAAFLPMTTLVAIIAGVVLVVDDLITMFQGGESVIGGVINKLLEIEGVKKTFGWLVDKIDYMIEGFKTIARFMGVDFAESNAPRGFGSIDDTRVSKIDTPRRPEATLANANMVLSSFLNQPKPLMSSPINQDIKIDIKTSDPERAGRAVQESLQKHLNDAQAQTGNGGF